MRRAKLDPLHAAALVSTGSLVIYLPIYLAMYGRRLAQIPLADITVQAMFQGVLVTIVSLLLMAVRWRYWALRVVPPLELWYRRCRRSLQYLSSGSGQATQIG
jgi:hypothetical protein